MHVSADRLKLNNNSIILPSNTLLCWFLPIESKLAPELSISYFLFLLSLKSRTPKLFIKWSQWVKKDLFCPQRENYFFNSFPSLIKHFMVCWQPNRNFQKQSETQPSKILSIGCQKFWRTATVVGRFSSWSLLLDQVKRKE